MAYNSNNVRQTDYDVTFGAVDLGGVDDVTPNMELMLKPIKIGSAGEMKLDDIFTGLKDDAHLYVVVREVQLAKIRSLVPWAAGSGAIALAPPIGTRMLQFALATVLHPRDASGQTEDITIFKTVPVQSFLLARNGADFDKWEITLNVYPDPTKLASGVNPYFEIHG